MVYVTYRANIQVLLGSGIDVISRSCKAPSPACSRQAIMWLYVQSATSPPPELLGCRALKDRKHTCYSRQVHQYLDSSSEAAQGL